MAISIVTEWKISRCPAPLPGSIDIILLGHFVVAHLNHDGILDVALDGYNLGIYMGRSDGTFDDLVSYYPVPGDSRVVNGRLVRGRLHP